MNSAWLAGFVDGEGCISFSTLPYGWQIRVTISNTSLSILEKIRNQYGGTLSVRQVKPNWKPTRSLTLSSRKATTLLRDIYPFLVLKRPQANIALEFETLLEKPGKTGTMTQRKQVLVDRIHGLNRKGVQKEN